MDIVDALRAIQHADDALAHELNLDYPNKMHGDAADEIERLRGLVHKHYSDAINLDADLAKVKDQLAAAEKDAERWREFQRNTRFIAYYWPGTMSQAARPLDYQETERLIDAAIAKEKE